MEYVAFEYVLDYELERPTSAKSLDMQYFLQIIAKLFAALPVVTITKRLWSASRYDFTSGSHNIDFASLGCVFCLCFLIFSFTIVKTDYLKGVSIDVSNLFFLDIFSIHLSNA